MSFGATCCIPWTPALDSYCLLQHTLLYILLSSWHILFASLVLHDLYFICAVSLCRNSLNPLLLLSLQLHCYVSTLKRTLCPQQQVSNCHFSCSTVVHTLYPSSGEGLKPDSCSKHHLVHKKKQKKTRESSLLNPAKRASKKMVCLPEIWHSLAQLAAQL